MNKMTTHTGFGIKDERGRDVGAQVTTFEDVTELQPGVQPQPGQVLHAYVLQPHITRNGKPYGAYSGTRRFSSELGRDRAAKEYLDSARDRALKQFATCSHGVVGARRRCAACAAGVRA